MAVALSAAAALTTAAAASAEPTVPDGTITTWGLGYFGVLDVPESLEGKTVTAVATGGNHSLALTSDGIVTAWGNNYGGQIDVPSSLDGRTVTAIAAAGFASVALTSDGKVTSWGVLGPDTAPADLDDQRVTAIAGGYDHLLALTSTGKVLAWGGDHAGQTDVPASLDGKTVSAISAGFGWSMALTTDGVVTTWGSGDPQRDDFEPQAPVPAVPDTLTGERVVAISAGYGHLTAATEDGDVVTWGPRASAALAQEPASLAGKTITSLAAADGVTFALTSDGNLVEWGDAGAWPATVPASLSGRRVTAVASSYYHAMAVTSRRALVAAGDPTIAGTARVGQTLTATAPTYDATPDAVAFQWYADGEPISGATASSLELTTAHVGASITVATTATKADHVDAVNTSASVGPVAQAPVITPNPPAPAPVPAPSAPKAPGATAGIVYSKAPTSGVVLAGRGTPGATITVREGSTAVGTTKVDTQGRWTLTVTSLRPGRHAFSATQTVDGRTSAASAAGAVTIARLKVTIVKAVSPTAAKRPVVRGRGNPGAKIVVRTTAGRKLGTTTVKANGSWALRTTKLKRGAYKVRATQTIAGQTIRSTTIRFRTTARS